MFRSKLKSNIAAKVQIFENYIFKNICPIICFSGSSDNLRQRVQRARPKIDPDVDVADRLGEITGNLATTKGILIFAYNSVIQHF